MTKIIRVEKPKGEVTRRSLFIVYFEDDEGKEYPSYQNPEEDQSARRATAVKVWWCGVILCGARCDWAILRIVR